MNQHNCNEQQNENVIRTYNNFVAQCVGMLGGSIWNEIFNQLRLEVVRKSATKSPKQLIRTFLLN